ncbi:MAG TPA: hypothetical protein DDY25_07495, partial [Peptococcaceae bacterium]|nr:hypothetical protein [Peptococcaceae bacterium]
AKVVIILPPQKLHCSNLAADALHKAIEDWQQKPERRSELSEIINKG